MKKICFIMAVILVMAVFLPQVSLAEDIYPGFKVEGRFLYDKDGEKVVLYGVNKMIVWMDIDGEPSYSEIAKTGSNVVRIVWVTTAPARKLDEAIYNCRKNNMIPMVELHDATGDWSKLPSLVDYWVSPDVVAVLKKHQEYLLVNIGNEVGNQVSEADFKLGYETAITRMRNAGIHVPLIIDAPNYGQNINTLQSVGPGLIEFDPDHNLMFSVHMWWPYAWGYSDQRVIDEINESVTMGLPLIVGEFGHQWDTTESGAIPYKTIIEQCHLNEVGYIPWSWGPGNNPQTFLDMTTDGTFDGLKDWGLEVCINNPHSIKNIAVRPASILKPIMTDPPGNKIPEGSLAENKPVVTSSEESPEHAGKYAVDADPNTRWASLSSDPQYIYVDLGAEYDIGRVYLEWETAYARQYKIQVSNDASTWTDVLTEYNGDGDIDDIELSAKARYVRVYCMQRANYQWGNSIYVFAVYPEGGVTPPPVSPTPTIPVSPSPTSTLGDVNNDGSIDSTDLTLVKRHVLRTSILTGSAFTAADVDASGSVDSTDITYFKRYILKIINVFPGA